jgi:hypothetical protein
VLYPHASNEYHIVSPTKHEADYIRVPAGEALEPFLVRGLRLRKSAPGHPPQFDHAGIDPRWSLRNLTRGAGDGGKDRALLCASLLRVLARRSRRALFCCSTLRSSLCRLLRTEWIRVHATLIQGKIPQDHLQIDLTDSSSDFAPIEFVIEVDPGFRTSD